MEFKDFQKKNIPGLTFYGDVTEKGLVNLKDSYTDSEVLEKESKCCKLEDFLWPNIDQDFIDDKGKKVVFAKVPSEVSNMNFKGPFYREILKSHNILKFESIRWYVNINREFYVQVIFS
ncbi:hypothetical protein [Enterococcus wangshanyuanii]|uniref:Uncharacterized protein n=1 Tax=Enterococcus wangshanyuanii TaxID=2005703 RepID=A0ABQ1PSM9_9ENTE|nr:hypothetical protein [Enterococcus wangshanyuanii]GGD02797.1 hypothetical protein GCM10011573_35360 [Enterococcus wangshanyuanii]